MAARVLSLGCALVVALGCVSAASAAQSPVVADCNAHGRLTHHYSVAQLRHALVTMSADVKEYTDCYDVIQRALLAQLSGIRGGGGGSDQGSGGSFLPTPLIVLLVLLALAAATFGALAIRRRGSAGSSGP